MYVVCGKDKKKLWATKEKGIFENRFCGCLNKQDDSGWLLLYAFCIHK